MPRMSVAELAETRAGQAYLDGLAPRRKKDLPRISESQHAMRFAGWLRQYLEACWFAVAWTHLPLGGLRDRGVAARLKAEGVNPGFPDYLICWPWGLQWIELKAEGGRLSDSQRETIPILRALGHRVDVCIGFDAAKKAVLDCVGENSDKSTT